MFDDLLHRLKSHYLDALLLGTRITDSVGGALVVYYAHLTLRMQEPTLGRFIVACAVVVVIAILLSLVFAYWETRHLRLALKMLFDGRTPDQTTLIKAGEEAVVFPARHHWTEAWLVPSTTLLPVLIYLGCFEKVPVDTMTNVTLAALMGIGLALMATFFVIERGMQPLVRYLLDNGAATTPYLRFGARVRISAIDHAGRSPLGAIDQRIVTSRLGGAGAADGTV